MSGVRHGTRLDQLLKLRIKLDQEISAEKRRTGVGTVVRKKHGPQKDHMGPRLEALGVTSSRIKQWAKAQGLIREIKKGRLAWQLLEAYADAHPADGGSVGHTATTHGAR